MPLLPRPGSTGRISSRQNLLQGRADEEEAAPLDKASPRMQRPAASRAPKAESPSPFLLAGALLCAVALLWSFQIWPFSAPEPSFVFLSIGDFGTGSDSQKHVAAQMAVAAAKHNAHFILSLGDNMYDRGVASLEDPLFDTNFENVYTQPELQMQWLMALGDHDHRGSVAAQIAHSDHSHTWHMPSNYYSKLVPLAEGVNLQLLVTDSVCLEGVVAKDDLSDRRFLKDYNKTLVGHEAGLLHLQWLQDSLRFSHAQWKIVVGHRPVLTSGDRPRYPAEARFPALIQPLLEHFHVDAYLFGHDHIGQHLEQGGVVYLGNGVGGYGNHDVLKTNHTMWADGSYMGFMLHRLTAHKMVTSFINQHGDVLHTVEIHHSKSNAATSRRHLLQTD